MEELGIEKKEETEIELAQTNLKQAASISTAKDKGAHNLAQTTHVETKDENTYDRLEELKDETKVNITGKLIESIGKDLEFEPFEDTLTKQIHIFNNTYTKDSHNQINCTKDEIGYGNVQENIDEELNSNESKHSKSNLSHSFCTGNSSQHEVPSEPLLAKHIKCSYCNKCNMKRPMRTHHCSVCNKCVMRMDHHCAWIANCVGINNHKFYVLFLIYTSLLALCMTLLDFFTCCNLYFEEKVKILSFDFIYYSSSSAISIIITFLTGNLALYQIKMIMLDRTTLEDITNQYKANKIKDLENAKYVMGIEMYLWWLPIYQKLKPQEESSLLD